MIGIQRILLLICTMTKHKCALYNLKAKWEDEPNDQGVVFPRQPGAHSQNPRWVMGGLDWDMFSRSNISPSLSMGHD